MEFSKKVRKLSRGIKKYPSLGKQDVHPVNHRRVHNERINGVEMFSNMHAMKNIKKLTGK